MDCPLGSLSRTCYVSNRLEIAEACARCGLVERSGQGVDRMFEESLREGKPVPDFSGTDAHQVTITILDEIQNPQFTRFLERASAERQVSFSVEELVILDSISKSLRPDPRASKDRLAKLVDAGIVERTGRGRDAKYVLSRRFHSYLGKSGTYTRERGLDRETNKELLLRHIKESGTEGAKLSELQQVLKDLSRAQVQTLLREIRSEGRAHVVGLTKAGRWFTGTGAHGGTKG